MGKYRRPAKRVAESFPLDKIDLPTRDCFELLPKRHQVEEAERRFGSEADEKVEVAVRPEVLSNCGPKYR